MCWTIASLNWVLLLVFFGSSQYLYQEDLSAKPPTMATVDGHAGPVPARSESLASDRFTAALANVTEMGQSLESLQHMLGKAVYADEEAFANASAVSKQTRTVKVCTYSEIVSGKFRVNN